MSIERNIVQIQDQSAWEKITTSRENVGHAMEVEKKSINGEGRKRES